MTSAAHGEKLRMTPDQVYEQAVGAICAQSGWRYRVQFEDGYRLTSLKPYFEAVIAEGATANVPDTVHAIPELYGHLSRICESASQQRQ
jgi:hypothetical protein